MTERSLIHHLQNRSDVGLRSILEGIHDFVVVLDREGCILYVNHMRPDQTLEQLQGVSILNDAWVTPETQSKLREGLRRAFEEGASSEIEMQAIAIGAKELTHWYSSRLFPLVEEGRVTAAVYLSTDITDSKNSRLELEEKAELQRAILSSIHEGVFALNSDLEFTLWNKGMEMLFGEKAADIVGRGVHPWDIHESMTEAETRELYRKVSDIEFVRREATGPGLPGDGARHFLSTYHALRDPMGRQFGVVGVVRDTTAAVRTRDRERRIDEQMREAQRLESLGVLAGGIAHDFNNILVSVLGFAELGEMRLPEDSPVRPMLAEIQAGAKQAAHLCRQMLAYAGKGQFLLEELSVNQLVSELMPLIQASIAKNATLKTNLQFNLPHIRADRSQINQVIMNLITNASEALGGEDGSITLATGQMLCERGFLREQWACEDPSEGHYVYISVADTGCGMDPATLNRMCDPFFTTKFMGRGLGMAAVLGIVRAHNGAIRGESQEGRGAEIRILMPASGAAGEEVPAPEERVCETKTGLTALIVDDENSVRVYLRAALESLDFSVIEACEGREAVEIYRRRGSEIDIVILDMTMPVMGGEEAFRVMRTIDPEVRVILSSGYDEQNATSRFAGQGLTGFLQKPYSLAALRRAIDMATSPPGA